MCLYDKVFLLEGKKVTKSKLNYGGILGTKVVL